MGAQKLELCRCELPDIDITGVSGLEGVVCCDHTSFAYFVEAYRLEGVNRAAVHEALLETLPLINRSKGASCIPCKFTFQLVRYAPLLLLL